MAATTKLKAVIEAEDKASSVFAKAGQSISKSFKSAEAGSKALGVAIAGAGAGMLLFAKQSVDAYNIQAAAEAKLTQLHKENTGATDAQVQALKDQASALQRVGIIGDESIINGQAQLATFKLSTKAIESLTPAMADMVAQQKGTNATGEDFVNIGNLIGKVMEGNVGALGRYGVSFDEASEKILKNGTEQEKAAELAKVLANNYGGVNEALRNTPEGKIQAFKNDFGDLQEGLGKLIQEGLAPVVGWLSDMTAKIAESGGLVAWFTKLVSDNQTVVIAIAGAIMVGLVPALVAMAAGIWGALAPLIPFLAIGAAIGIAFKALADRVGGVGVVFDALKSTMSGIKDVMGGELIINSQGLFEALLQLGFSADQADGILMTLQQTFDTIVGFWNGQVIPTVTMLWQKFQEIALLVWNYLKPSLESLATAIGGLVMKLIEMWNANKDWIIPTITTLATIIGTIVVVAIKILIDTITWLVNAITSYLLPAFQWVIDMIRNYVIPTFMAIVTFILTVLSPIINFFRDNWTNIWKVISSVFSIAWNAIKTTFLVIWAIIETGIKTGFAIIKGVFQTATALLKGDWQGAWNAIKDTFLNVWDSVKSGVSNGIGAIVDLFRGLPGKVGDVLSGLGGIIKNAISSAVRATPGIGDKVADLLHLAGGTTFAPGGMAVVGENGPELVNLPRGSRVYSNPQTQAMAGSGTTTNTFNFNISGSDPNVVAMKVKQILDTQLALSSKAAA